MKELKKFFNSSTILGFYMVLAAAIFSCSNLGGDIETQETSVQQFVPQQGRIIVKANIASSAARSAMPSDFNASSFVYAAALYAGQDYSDEMLVQGAYNAGVATFSFEKPSATTGLTLEVFAFPSGTTTFSRATATLCAKVTGVAIESNSISTNVTLAVNSTSTQNGSVNLSIKVPENCTLSASCDDSDFDAANSLTGSGQTYTLAKTGLKPKSYTVTFIVQKDSKPIYIWQEIVNVFPGMTTNKWSDVTEGDAKEIKTAQINSTFYVRGSDFSDGTKSWYTTNLSSATASDENLGTLMAPLATLQEAINRIKNGASSEYTIYIDGTVNDSNITLDGNVNLVIQGLTASYDDNIIQSSKPGEYIFGINNGANVTFKNLSITGANVTDGNMYGGAIRAAANTDIVFDNVHAYNNKAAYGGVIYTDGNVTLQNGTVFGDKTKTTTATSSSYSNYAIWNSGAIRAGGGTITIKSGCYIAYNYVTRDGGGITVQGAGTVIIENGAFIQYNAITGNGGGINFGNANNTATISGNIIGNSASLNGGGIYIGGGTVTIEGGEISGNTANSNGGGVYVYSGTFTMGGAAQIPAGTDGKNDVYLNSGKYITVTGALTGTSPVATITLPSASYAAETQVLAAGGSVTELTQAICNQFALSDTNFVIQPDGTKGVLVSKSVSASGSIQIEIPNYSEYTATLSPSSSPLTFGGSVTLTLKKNGAEVTPSSCTMELYTSDDLVTPITTSSETSITIPAFLSATGNNNFKVRIVAQYDGVLILDGYYDITAQ